MSINPNLKTKKTKTLLGLSNVLCGVLTCLLLAGSLTAQQAPKQDAIAENLFAPDVVLSNQKAIGLDDAQKTFVRSEVLKAQAKFTEIQFQLQDAMESLAELLKQNPVDEAQALTQLDKVLNSEREVKRAQIALMVRIKNKLTLDQQSRLRQLRDESH